jgi:hypothetical protein
MGVVVSGARERARERERRSVIEEIVTSAIARNRRALTQAVWEEGRKAFD